MSWRRGGFTVPRPGEFVGVVHEEVIYQTECPYSHDEPATYCNKCGWSRAEENLARALWSFPENVISLEELNRKADAGDGDYVEHREFLYRQVAAVAALSAPVDEMDPAVSEYPKIIERPYHVYSGEPEYVDAGGNQVARTRILWSYESSYTSEHSAQIAADRLSARSQFVKIEEREQ